MSAARSSHAVAQRSARPPAASIAPARPIPIRIVPRAAVEALVARLVASGAVAAPTREAPRCT